MAITRISYGAFRNIFSAANQPVAGTFAAGDFIFVFTGEFIGTDLLSTPSGFTLESPNSLAKQTAVFGLQSVTGSEAMPSMTWGSQFSWAIVGVYRGLNNLTVVASGDRQSNQTTSIIGPSLAITPPVSGCLALFVASKDKTSASDSSTFSAPSGFTVAAQQTQAGAKTANIICEWIQTAATTIAANSAVTGSVADATAQPSQGIIIVLEPATSVQTPSRSLLGVGT
jgi:hypothetical protein